MFRAADYVAETINLPKPKRPETGPEAAVPLNVTSQNQKQISKLQDDIEELLDKIDYPSSAVKQILLDNSKYIPKPAKPIIPKIVITPNNENDNCRPSDFNLRDVTPRNNETSETDLIRFSSRSIIAQEVSSVHDTSKSDKNGNAIRNVVREIDTSSGSPQLPEISIPLESESDSYLPEFNLQEPAFSELLNSTTPSSQCHVDGPNLSDIHFSDYRDTYSNQSINYDLMPDLSVLNEKSEHLNNEVSGNNLPVVIVDSIDLSRSNSSSLNQDLSSTTVSNNIPDFNALSLSQNKSKTEEIRSNSSPSRSNSINISSCDSNSRPCNSPLPHLSLNTQLPHFSYHDLMKATNNFNENLYTDEIANGRFLGSGAFGSVFLAFGLMERPVAVKKLMLENVDYVDIDATVTKQFKNEVEILSHYKHENLLSLVGYSCDGCTYCLLYEYVQGRDLSVRLQVSSY